MKRSKINGRSSTVNETVVTVAPAPKQGAPSVPKTVPNLGTGGVKRLPLQQSQIACTPAVAEEFSEAKNPVADFGPHIPSFTALSAGLAIAGGWSDERIRAEAWRRYARSQEIAAWTPVLAMLNDFEQTFENAVASDPSLAAEFRSLALFYSLRRQQAQKAARTRKAKKAAETTNPPAPPAEPGSSKPQGQ